MDWLSNIVKSSIWGFILDFIKDIMDKAFNLIADLILQASDINKYFNASRYVVNVQAVAGALLVLAVVWEAIKHQTGGVLPGEEKSLGKLAGQTVVGGVLIFFLPWSVTNIFLRLNNGVIQMIKDIGVEVKMSVIVKALNLNSDPSSIGGLIIILTLVLSVGLIGLGISAGIRAVELIIIIIISPIVAVSSVKSYDAIQIWVRETVAVVFTQSVQLLLLQILMVVLINLNGVMMLIMAIGCVVLSLKGPQVLRQFL